MATVQLLHGDRLILEDCTNVNNGLPSHVPREPPEPPDTSTRDNGNIGMVPWYLGFLHIMSEMVNHIMTIPLQVKHGMDKWTSKIKIIKVDNNGIKPETSEWDKGVPCACPSFRSCSVYDTCQQRCMRTKDRSGAGVPILPESDTERSFEANNGRVKCHIESRRMIRSSHTQQLEWSYRRLLKGIILSLSHLVQDNHLPYNILKRWMYTLRPDLGIRIQEKKPGVEKIFNEFCPRFYDTNRLSKLLMKVEEYLPTVKTALQRFEDELDTFLSNRVFLHGFGSDGQQNAVFCVDPEWRAYPARDLFQIHKRVREALQRVRGEQFVVIYFCTVLKEYMILNHVESFIQKIKERVERQPIHVREEKVEEDRAKFPSSIEEIVNCGRRSVLITGIKLGPRVIFSFAKSQGGWSSLEYYDASMDHKRVTMIGVNKYFLNSFGP